MLMSLVLLVVAFFCGGWRVKIGFVKESIIEEWRYFYWFAECTMFFHVSLVDLSICRKTYIYCIVMHLPFAEKTSQ